MSAVAAVGGVYAHEATHASAVAFKAARSVRMRLRARKQRGHRYRQLSLCCAAMRNACYAVFARQEETGMPPFTRHAAGFQRRVAMNALCARLALFRCWRRVCPSRSRSRSRALSLLPAEASPMIAALPGGNVRSIDDAAPPAGEGRLRSPVDRFSVL